jgi:hypothetical protein
MNKKKVPDDLKGFEEFIESEPDKSFMGKPQGGPKKDSVEHMTFLTNDANRLNKARELLADKIPFATQFEQGKQLLKDQKQEMDELRKRIFALSDEKGSPLRRNLAEIFNSFYKPQN